MLLVTLSILIEMTIYAFESINIIERSIRLKAVDVNGLQSFEVIDTNAATYPTLILMLPTEVRL